MALSPEFTEFYSTWSAKARPGTPTNLHQAFDQFFTLYVLFNRLYAEATFRLARRKQVKLTNRNRFPDCEAAQEYVVQYIGATQLLGSLNAKPEVRRALSAIRNAVCLGPFSIKLDMVTGNPQPEKDRDLCQRLRDGDSNAQAVALMETLYAIRCNMFHGHKGFRSIQLALLEPVNVVLEKVMEILYTKLCENND